MQQLTTYLEEAYLHNTALFTRLPTIALLAISSPKNQQFHIKNYVFGSKASPSGHKHKDKLKRET